MKWRSTTPLTTICLLWSNMMIALRMSQDSKNGYSFLMLVEVVSLKNLGDNTNMIYIDQISPFNLGVKLIINWSAPWSNFLANTSITQLPKSAPPLVMERALISRDTLYRVQFHVKMWRSSDNWPSYSIARPIGSWVGRQCASHSSYWRMVRGNQTPCYLLTKMQRRSSWSAPMPMTLDCSVAVGHTVGKARAETTPKVLAFMVLSSYVQTKNKFLTPWWNLIVATPTLFCNLRLRALQQHDNNLGIPHPCTKFEVISHDFDPIVVLML